MVNIATNASGAILWPNLQLLQVVPLVANFETNASGAIWLTNASAFSLTGEITQVSHAIPWVRCAFGNVWLLGLSGWMALPAKSINANG